ncbi:DEAD/DEAH box helicase [Paenibacillus yanchengensis]|uniref:DEAD/DEAH box helicase n=1 Tax=Paenibacillus yanchengensis TaxID=2035833 RepID=A0ABW4YLD5_9BACL
MTTETTWASLGLTKQWFEKLQQHDIVQPTAIQEQAIPAILAGKDIIARSQTGTGKTFAFLLPVLQLIDKNNSNIQAVILAPTQELAMQLVRVAELYTEDSGIRTQQLIGGAALQRQVDKLKLKPQLVIGTPGRVAELLKIRKLKLTTVRTVVVDEADQMFNLGSTKDLEAVLFAIGREKQKMFFSATYPIEMTVLQQRWMKEPTILHIEPEQRVVKSISNYYMVCERRDKLSVARRVIRMLEPKKALLFLNETDQIANWETKLRYEGFKIEAIYGDANKMQRAETMAKFREGTCQLLLATDLAARGLDIADLPLILQLDPAIDADHYVHRAGRTGRMGREGTVITLVTPQELFIMKKFSKQLNIDIQEYVMFKGNLMSPEKRDELASIPVTFRKPRASTAKPTQQSRTSAVSAPKKQVNKNAQEAPAKQQANKKTQEAPRSNKRVKPEKDKDKGAPKWLKQKRKS